MKQPPRRNLPPDSEQWGRFIESQINDLDRQQTQLAQANTNSLAAVNSTLVQLSGQVAQINNVVSMIAQQQQELSAQQGQLDLVVNSIPVTSSLSSSVEGFTTINGTKTETSVTFPVPPGKTRCSVFASFQGFFGSDFSVPQSSLAGFNLTVTGGYVGPWAVMAPDNMDTYWVIGNGGVQLNNVSGSVTVGVRSMAGPQVAPPSDTNALDLFATATFS